MGIGDHELDAVPATPDELTIVYGREARLRDNWMGTMCPGCSDPVPIANWGGRVEVTAPTRPLKGVIVVRPPAGRLVAPYRYRSKLFESLF